MNYILQIGFSIGVMAVMALTSSLLMTLDNANSATVWSGMGWMTLLAHVLILPSFTFSLTGFYAIRMNRYGWIAYGTALSCGLVFFWTIIILVHRKFG